MLTPASNTGVPGLLGLTIRNDSLPFLSLKHRLAGIALTYIMAENLQSGNLFIENSHLMYNFM